MQFFYKAEIKVLHTLGVSKKMANTTALIVLFIVLEVIKSNSRKNGGQEVGK